MPGEYVHHNADSVFQSTLIWNIDIDKFMNDDFQIFAKARVFNKTKTAVLLSILLVIFVFIIKRKYSKV